MRTPLWAAATACWVLLSMSAASPAKAADPTLGDVPNEQQMQAYVAYWVGAIRDARADANAITARDKLIEGYRKMEGKDAGYTFADKAASAGADALTKGFGGDVLAKVKEINLAIALAQMSQVSIHPALETMLASRDPGVRLYAWQGYRAVRRRIFLQGLRPWTQKALAFAAQAAQGETSPLVLKELFHMLEMDGARPDLVAKDVWEFARKESLAILDKNWPRWCRQVLAGDEDLADSCRSAVTALVSHADWVSQDKAMHTALLQKLVDLAFCAATGYKARAADKPGDGFSNLMRDCEAALNAVMKTNKEFIKKPLGDPRVTKNPGMVLLWVVPGSETTGMMAWVDFLKDQGVKEPTIQAPATGPATAPTSRPAPAPGK